VSGSERRFGRAGSPDTTAAGWGRVRGNERRFGCNGPLGDRMLKVNL
jgi:hypothetical protein